jgi:two-component system, NtrC family, sensor histidine kinase HydH
MAPNTYFLFLVNLVVVVGVVLFATGVVVILLRRADERRMQEQRLAAVGTATARILHQIKNPLQTILLHSEFLEESFEQLGATERREVCRAIASESERLNTMLGELSQWAAGTRRQLSLEPFPLDMLVVQLGRIANGDSDADGVHVDVHVDGQVQIMADGYFLQQALDNLVRNARDAMSGQAGAKLELRLERTGQTAHLYVADNGPGIPAERLREIFEPFVSTKGNGMGLGLPITKEIIEGHGGSLEVDSQVGKGTTFRIALPVNTDREPSESGSEVVAA